MECASETDIQSMTSIKETLGLDDVYSKVGLTGQSVKVGITDAGTPVPNNEITYTEVGTNLVQNNSHGTNTARAIASSEVGIAPNVTLYATDYFFSNIEQLISTGVKVINASIGWSADGENYSSFDKWFDHITSQHRILLVCSAGNNGDTQSRILSPAMAFNVVTVGEYTDNNTGNNQSDDYLYLKSSYNNLTGCEKPDLIAPANVLGGGTSTSAPIVTGIVALMLEFKPSLASFPEVIKAILLASSQRKVINPTGVAAETMSQGITDRQGVGAVDAWNAICIIAREQYGYGSFSGAEETRNFVQPKYGATNMNVSIAWLRNNTASGEHANYNNVTAGVQKNLNLSVHNNNTVVGQSNLANSSTEMAYFPLSNTSDKYQLRISNADISNTDSVRYAYAWSTDKMTYQERQSTANNVPNEGMYYIRHSNGQYLTVDESTGQIAYSPFTGERNQQWIVDVAENNKYTIKTRSLVKTGGLNKASSGNNAVVDPDTDFLIYFDYNGSYTLSHRIYTSTGTTSVHLQLYNGQFGWFGNGAPTNFQWNFERVGYQKGDVDFDGSFTNQDVLLVQKKIAKIMSFADDQSYLADANCDGEINSSDVLAIQRLISNG